MKTRTFQEIYDFCRTDLTYQAYFHIPDAFCLEDWTKARYYYGEFSGGRSRKGTFIYTQSMRQLERFLRGTKQDHYLHANSETFEVVNRQKYDGPAIYIVTHIRKEGVRIEFSHPFYRTCPYERIAFTARSHRTFTVQGIIAEVRAYIERRLLLAPGRYRALQLEYQIPKEKFPAWYRQYRKQVHEQEEYAHWEMVDRYLHQNDITFEEGYQLLAASGMFYDFNCDEYERDELTEEFVRLCNSTHSACRQETNINT